MNFLSFYNTTNGQRVNFFLYLCLVLLLAAVFFISIGYEVFIQGLFEIKPDSNETILSKIFTRIPLLLPIVWLASHVNGVINRRGKLYVEYEHKRIAMEFYTAFKEEVKENPKTKEYFDKAVADVVLRYPSIIGEPQESDSPMDKILNTFKEKNKKSTIGSVTIEK